MQMYRRQTEGKSIYQGRSWRLRVNQAKKSAEVIVLEGKRDANRNCIGLTNKEGLNVNLQEIRLGKLSQPSLKVNYGQLKRCKELLIDDLRTAEYVTRTLGGVRGSPCQFLAGQSTRLPAVFFYFCQIICIYDNLSLILQTQTCQLWSVGTIKSNGFLNLNLSNVACPTLIWLFF